jgi:tRNA-dihydrouridine synthase B
MPNSAAKPSPTPEERSPQLRERRLALGERELAGVAVQAALSGYSDLPMRRVARAHGCPYALHEVVLDEHVLLKGKGSARILHVPDDDHPVGGQLMGSRPELFGDAARRMIEAGYDVLDINFGCPVRKVLGRCRGGYLLQEPHTALEIVERVLDAAAGDVPVTIKMRRGYDDEPQSEEDFFAILEGAFQRGIVAATIHGRSVLQKYVGPSDWSFLSRVKQRFPDRTILGSGDLFSADDALRMLLETGVDGVSLARGCIGNPFLFREIAALLRGDSEDPPSLREQHDALRLHWQESVLMYGAERAVRKTRRHAIQYAALHPEPVQARDAFAKAKTPAQFEHVLEDLYR